MCLHQSACLQESSSAQRYRYTRRLTMVQVQRHRRRLRNDERLTEVGIIEVVPTSVSLLLLLNLQIILCSTVSLH